MTHILSSPYHLTPLCNQVTINVLGSNPVRVQRLIVARRHSGQDNKLISLVRRCHRNRRLSLSFRSEEITFCWHQSNTSHQTVPSNVQFKSTDRVAGMASEDSGLHSAGIGFESRPREDRLFLLCNVFHGYVLCFELDLVGTQVLTAVAVKSYILCDMLLCSRVKVK